MLEEWRLEEDGDPLPHPSCGYIISRPLPPAPSEDVGKEEKKEESREDRLAEARLQLGLRAPLPADGIHLRSRRMSSCFAEVAEPKLQSYDLGMWRAGNRHLSNT